MSRKIYGTTVTTPFNPAKSAGKSAYAYAVEGGYTGTEEDFAEHLANPYIKDDGEGNVELPVLGPMSVTDDGDGNVTVDALGAVFVTDDSEGNVEATALDAIATEPWVFTLEDGSTVTKQVVMK